MSGLRATRLVLAIAALAALGVATWIFVFSGERQTTDAERERVIAEAVALINHPAFVEGDNRTIDQADASVTDIVDRHLHPAVTQAYADDYHLSADRVLYGHRNALMSGFVTGHLSQELDLDNIAYGATRNWSWALIPLKSSYEEPGAVQFAPCTQWLVFWDDSGWYIHDAGMPAYRRYLDGAFREFRRVAFPPTTCDDA